MTEEHVPAVGQTGTNTSGTYQERVITHTSRKHIEVREADCLNCGETVSRTLDTRTFEWDAYPERCWQCGETTPWGKGLEPEFEDRNNRSVDTDGKQEASDR